MAKNDSPISEVEAAPAVVGKTVRVIVNKAITLNLGNYESLKVGAGLEADVLLDANDDLEKGIAISAEKLFDYVENAIQTEVQVSMGRKEDSGEDNGRE